MNLAFRPGKPEDLEALTELFRKATDTMNRNGIPQWDEIYPCREDLAKDIAQKQLFVGTNEENRIVVAYVINRECDPQYRDAHWRDNSGNHRILHRLCVLPEVQNQGVGTQTVLHLERQLKEEGITSIRLDAFCQNPYAISMYEHLGYTTAGYADLRKGRFALMEKIL